MVSVVDDDAAVRQSTQELLFAYGLEARCHPSAEHFLAAFDPDTVACIILDVHMPETSGLELLAFLRGKGIETPVIAYSGRADAALEGSVKRAGGTALLEKPVHAARLIGLVREILAARPALAGA
jgi:FixJ family two-component response regulator